MRSLIDYGLKSCILIEVDDLWISGRNIENTYIYFLARPIQTVAENPQPFCAVL